MYSAAILLFVGCAGPAAGAKSTIWISDRLFLGRDISGGEFVSDSAWNAFLTEIVTPRFPTGFTIWRAEGQWRDSTGAIVKENVFVLEVLHDEHREIEEEIIFIINHYKKRFRQEAVLRTRGIMEVTFH
jgi:hypothetical protein